MRLISHARFVAYLLLLCLTGYAAAQDKVVSIDQEPRHKLVFSNDLLRIFDTRIPAGDVSLYPARPRSLSNTAIKDMLQILRGK